MPEKDFIQQRFVDLSLFEQLLDSREVFVARFRV